MRSPWIVGVALAFACVAGCSSSEETTPPPRLTSAVVETRPLDDAQIASAEAMVERGQNMLARLAAERGDSEQVRDLGRSFLAVDNSPMLAQRRPAVAPSLPYHETAAWYANLGMWLEQEPAENFDQDLLASERAAIVSDLRLVDATLMPGAADPQLKSGLLAMRGVLERKLDTVEKMHTVVPRDVRVQER